MNTNLNDSKPLYAQKYSPYLIMAEKYCVQKGWFHIDPISNGKIIEPEDMWQAIINIREWENKNRRKKVISNEK